MVLYFYPQDKPDMKVARLRMDRIFIQMFQKYNLGAKNEKGLSTHSLSLDRGKDRLVLSVRNNGDILELCVYTRNPLLRIYQKVSG